MEKKPITPAVAGLIMGMVSIILFLGYYYAGLMGQQNVIGFIPLGIFIAMVIVFINMWAKSQNNVVTYGSLFGYGFKAVSITTLIVFVFMAIFIYVFPDYKEYMIDLIKQQMNKDGKVTAEQLEKTMEIMSKFFVISTLGGSLFGNLFVGTIASLIGAAIPKKYPNDPFTQINQIGQPE